MADFTKAVSGTELAVMYGPQVQADSKCFSFWFILDTLDTATLRVKLNDTNDIIFLTEGKWSVFCLLLSFHRLYHFLYKRSVSKSCRDVRDWIFSLQENEVMKYSSKHLYVLGLYLSYSALSVIRKSIVLHYNGCHKIAPMHLSCSNENSNFNWQRWLKHWMHFTFSNIWQIMN